VEKRTTGIYDLAGDDNGMRAVEGKKHIEQDYPDYLRDESNLHGDGASKLFFPENVGNICWVLRQALSAGEKVTVSGGRTGICGGCVPREGWMLSLERMNSVLGIQRSAGGFELEVQSGLRLSELGTMVRTKRLPVEDTDSEEFARTDRQYFYPPDPTETTATIGGTVATNASGARTLYYGPTRCYVNGLSLVLPTGELLVIRRGEVSENEGRFTVRRNNGPPLEIPSPQYRIPSTKHSAGLYSKPGMDLIDLFIGCEGILGVIASVTLVLLPEPSSYFAGIGFFGDEGHALRFVEAARKPENSPLALEYFDSQSLLLLEEVRQEQGPTSEIPDIPGGGEGAYAVYFESAVGEKDSFERCVARYRDLISSAGGDPRIAWGAVTKRDLGRLKNFRHALPEMVNRTIAENKRRDPSIHKVGTDMAVPDDRLFDMMRFYRDVLGRETIRHVVFGHIGNNHLHVNLIPESNSELIRAKELYGIFAQKAVGWGGSVSAEHGIGKLKRQYLPVQFGEEEIEQMMRIKKVLDPDSVLNPGNLL
jgi:D-lactate dehydrogenase (cytochrome)